MKTANTLFLVLMVATSGFSFAGGNESKVCKAQTDCESNEFCNTSPGCNDGTTEGVCTVKPEICTMEYMPVKGCNSETYASKCQAYSAGQPVTGPAEETTEQ